MARLPRRLGPATAVAWTVRIGLDSSARAAALDGVFVRVSASMVATAAIVDVPWSASTVRHALQLLCEHIELRTFRVRTIRATIELGGAPEYFAGVCPR